MRTSVIGKVGVCVDTTMRNVAGESSPLGVLILTWLLTTPKNDTKGELYTALKPFLEHRWSAAEQRRAIDEVVDELERAGQIACTKRVRAIALTLTESGRRAALAALKLEAAPERTRAWGKLKKRLFAFALGLPPPTKKAARGNEKRELERLQAAILARRHPLGAFAFPTKRQVLDDLVWRELGVPPGGRLTVHAIHKLFLNRTLGTTKPLDRDKAFGLHAARAVGARRAVSGDLQIAVLRRWVSGMPIVPAETIPTAPGDGAPPPSSPRPIEPLDDDAFAARVLEVARASKTGRFGEDKVFISHVLRGLVQEGVVADDADAFKARLVSAHRRGLLSLSRADLVEAMDPKDVEASEARYLSATFHFVRI